MKLLKQNTQQRYYQLNFRIKKYKRTPKKVSTIVDLWKDDPINLLPEYELAEDITESVDKICVSDAHTHVERLVFPAFYVRNKETNEVELCHRNNQIDGKLTMMIHGGSEKDVCPDEVYIRHLRRINK